MKRYYGHLQLSFVMSGPFSDPDTPEVPAKKTFRYRRMIFYVVTWLIKARFEIAAVRLLAVCLPAATHFSLLQARVNSRRQTDEGCSVGLVNRSWSKVALMWHLESTTEGNLAAFLGSFPLMHIECLPCWYGPNVLWHNRSSVCTLHPGLNYTVCRQVWEYGQKIEAASRAVGRPTDLFGPELTSLRKKWVISIVGARDCNIPSTASWS